MGLSPDARERKCRDHQEINRDLGGQVCCVEPPKCARRPSVASHGYIMETGHGVLGKARPDELRDNERQGILPRWRRSHRQEFLKT